MKKKYLLLISAGLLFFCACSGSKQDKQNENDGPEIIQEELSELLGVCVWDKIALRDQPAESGKWLTSVNLGEKVTYLNEVKTDDSGTKAREYIKLRLIDGKEGWALKDFIVIDGTAAVFTADTETYQRPDLLAKSGKSFSKMDIVAIVSEKDDWLEITGKRKNGSWLESGWVKVGNLSDQDVDIAVAVYARKAFENKEEQEQMQEIRNIVENQDFSSSVFIPELYEIISPSDFHAELMDDDVDFEELEEVENGDDE